MSDLSEAIERAQKRLDKMTEEERFKCHVAVLREELARGGTQPLTPLGDI